MIVRLRGMSDKKRAADAPPADDAPRSWRNAWPFLVALAVVVIAVVGILSSNLLRPATDRASDPAQVQMVINDAYTARNSLDYGAYRSATCAREVNAPTFPTEQTFVADNTTSREANGHIVIPEITDITVTGDTATATAHWHYDKHPEQKQTDKVALVRENGDWKVCGG